MSGKLKRFGKMFKLLGSGDCLVAWSCREAHMPITDLGLSEPLVRALLQFDEATLVQVAAIPAALGGRDLLVKARTG